MWGLEAPTSLGLSKFVIGDEENVHGPQGGCLIVNVFLEGSCSKIMQGQRGGGGRVGRIRRRITNFATPKMKAFKWTRTNMFVFMNRRKEERTHFCINYVLQKHWTWLHVIVMMCCQFCIWWNLYEDVVTINWIYAIWDPLFTFKIKNHFNYMPSMRPRNYTYKNGTNCRYIWWNMS